MQAATYCCGQSDLKSSELQSSDVSFLQNQALYSEHYLLSAEDIDLIFDIDVLLLLHSLCQWFTSEKIHCELTTTSFEKVDVLAEMFCSSQDITDCCSMLPLSASILCYCDPARLVALLCS